MVAVLWAGSLWSLALWVAPTLFSVGNDRHVAGLEAARLFSIETYVGMAVGAFGLMLQGRARIKWGYPAVVLLMINEWLVKGALSAAQAHGSVLGLGFGPWHGISALIYVTACVFVAVLVWNEDFR